MVPRAALASCGLRAASVRSEWRRPRGVRETGGKWCAKGGFDDENMYVCKKDGIDPKSFV